MKKFILLATAAAVALAFVSCENSDSVGERLAIYNAAHQRKENTYPLYIQDTPFDFQLNFLNGADDLPYVEVDGMAFLLNSLFPLVDKPITVSKDGSVVTCVRYNETYDVETTLTIDFDKDLIRFEDYNLFLMKPICSTILDVTSMNFSDGKGGWRVIKRMEPKYLPRFGDPLEINLAKYGIDLVVRDQKYLVPLQTFSDVFIAPTFLNSLYFNGKSVIFASDMSKKGLPGNKKQRDLYYQGEKGERSEALAKFGYGELCMALDLLYGLKEQHGIESFDQLMQNQGAASMSVAKSIAEDYSLKSYLLGPNVFDADKAIYHLIGDFLDDNHAKWWNFSYLVGEKEGYLPNGAARERLDGYEKIYKAARDAYYSIDPATGKSSALGYQKVDNTAFVTFDSFAIDDAYYANPGKYYTEATADFPKDDTIGLIMKAHEEIFGNDAIKNVVIDLSVNFGGAADTAVFVAAWFLGETTVSFKDTSTGALCSTSYRCDANRDRKFDENDTPKGKRLFCLVSPCSFSCGNLVPNLFRESEKVTLLGKTSGGGACVVQPISSAWGTSFRISGPMRLCYMKNGSYYDIDQGARPDHSIEDPNFYYSNQRADLVVYINSLR